MAENFRWDPSCARCSFISPSRCLVCISHNAWGICLINYSLQDVPIIRWRLGRRNSLWERHMVARCGTHVSGSSCVHGPALLCVAFAQNDETVVAPPFHWHLFCRHCCRSRWYWHRRIMGGGIHTLSNIWTSCNRLGGFSCHCGCDHRRCHDLLFTTTSGQFWGDRSLVRSHHPAWVMDNWYISLPTLNIF